MGVRQRAEAPSTDYFACGRRARGDVAGGEREVQPSTVGNADVLPRFSLLLSSRSMLSLSSRTATVIGEELALFSMGTTFGIQLKYDFFSEVI